MDNIVFFEFFNNRQYSNKLRENPILSKHNPLLIWIKLCFL